MFPRTTLAAAVLATSMSSLAACSGREKPDFYTLSLASGAAAGAPVASRPSSASRSGRWTFPAISTGRRS